MKNKFDPPDPPEDDRFVNCPNCDGPAQKEYSFDKFWHYHCLECGTDFGGNEGTE